VQVVEEGALIVPPDIRAVDPADGEVHFGEAPGGLVGLLTVDGDHVGRVNRDTVAVAFLLIVVLVGLDELLALHEHTARPAAGVEDPAFIGFEHLHEELDDAPGRVELATLLPFGKGELPEEILIDLSEDVLALCLVSPQSYGADEVDKTTEACPVEVLPGIDLGKDPLQGRVPVLDGLHGLINVPADIHLLAVLEKDLCLLRVVGDPLPPGDGRYEEHPLGGILVGVLGIGPLVFALAFLQPGMEDLKGIGYVLQEYEAKDDVLVLGGIHVLAELIRGLPECRLDGFLSVILLVGLLRSCHSISVLA